MLIKISIITVVKNGMPHLKDCIKSIKNQTFKNIEHIVIYTDSTDGTLKLLKKNKKKIYYDNTSGNKFGAINKGIKIARGEYIALLHADDIFFDNNTLSNISNILMKKNFDVLYGDMIYVNENNISKTIRKWISKKYYKSMLNFGWMPPHTTLFIKKKILLRNPYKQKFSISGDYDFIIRLFKKKLKFYYFNKCLVKMRYGGDSNRSLKNILLKTQQDYYILKENKIKFPIFALLIKNISKITQFIK